MPPASAPTGLGPSNWLMLVHLDCVHFTCVEPGATGLHKPTRGAAPGIAGRPGAFLGSFWVALVVYLAPYRRWRHKMGTFPLQMDFMATRMPPLCCISLSKTPMKNNNRPTAPMAGPVGPAVKTSHFLRRASTRNPKLAMRYGKNFRKKHFCTLGRWLWPSVVVMMALLAPGARPPDCGARFARCRPTGQNQCFSRSHLVRLRLNV